MLVGVTPPHCSSAPLWRTWRGGDVQGAIEDYSQAITIDPQNVTAYFNRGNAKVNLGDKEGACHDYKKVTALGDGEASKWLKNKDQAWCLNMP